MKKGTRIALLVLAVSLTLLTMGCGGGKQVINVYNWGDYIDQSVLDQFQQETGIKVNYEMYETNEDMYTKLKNSNANYDVIIPSDYMIARLIAEDRVLPLDFNNIPNYKNIDSQFKNLDFDPQNQYSVPYMWGTVGILYNKTMVQGPVDSWTVMWDKKYAGSILMMNSQRDSIGITLKMLGYSLNTKNEAELEAAKQKLIEQSPLVLAYVVDEVKDKMIAGEAALALVWSGDAVYCMEHNKDLDFAIPKEGSNIFFDSVCIPKGSKNKKGAEEFINFLCRPDIAAKNALYIGYSSPSAAATALMGDAGKNPIAYPDLSKYSLEIFTTLGDDVKTYDRIWTEILTSVN